MGIIDKLFGGIKETIVEKPPLKSSQPEFVRKYSERGSGGVATYEIYKGENAESAREFLLKKRVDKKFYYIVVETQEGNWGIDVEGLYLERLLPWQRNISSAECVGFIDPMSSMGQFGLVYAAKGFNDNFITEVICGKCEHQWLDGICYKNITVVRCPKCKTLNKVDSNNIQVWLI